MSSRRHSHPRRLDGSNKDPATMQASATTHLVGLGFGPATTHGPFEMQDDCPRRKSEDTSDGKSESAETWGEFEAFSPLATRHYSLYAPSASSRSPSPSPSTAELHPDMLDADLPSLHPLRHSTGALGPNLSPSPSSSAFLSPTMSSASYSPRRRSTSPAEGINQPTRAPERPAAETWLPVVLSSTSSEAQSSPKAPIWSSGSANQLVHTRNLSLTSACPPVASGSPSKHRRDHFSVSSSISISPKQNLKKRNDVKPRWRPFSWTETPTAEEVASKADFRGSPSKRRRTRWNDPRRALCRCSAWLNELFAQSSGQKTTSKRTLHDKCSSVSSSSRQRKATLLLRLAIISYICFSLFYFTSSIIPLKPAGQSTVDTSLANDLGQWHRAKYHLSQAYRAASQALYARMDGMSGAQVAGDFGSDVRGALAQDESASVSQPDAVVKRHSTVSQDDATGLLSSFSHQYRFSKLSSKLDPMQHDHIEPYLFRAEQPINTTSITACLYYNDAWIDSLPAFTERWSGPISLVYEVLGMRNSTDRDDLLERVARLREENPSVRNWVDFHAVYTPQASAFQHSRSRERLITRPTGTNSHLNIARLFSQTELVWLVSDARILPSFGLRGSLEQSEAVRQLALEQMDAIVVPVFGAHRIGTTSRSLSDLVRIRDKAGLPGRADGVGAEEFSTLAGAHVAAHQDSLEIPTPGWPQTKTDLIEMAKQSRFGLHDRHWEAGKGPTDFNAWKTAPVAEDGHMGDAANSGFYQINGYDLHYNPSLVIGKNRQPWCTERFEYNRAVCSYQMYLQGAKMWVLPNEWAYTLESIDKGEKPKKSEAERLKSAIASRLYTKFHTEACMHYGRAFLAMDLWESERAQHLRYSCSQVLKSNGIGSAVSAKTE